MSLTTLQIPNLLGGVSTQPEAARFAGHAAAADNVVLSISDGTVRRQGSQWVATLTGYAADEDVRLAGLALDDGAEYLLALGASSARVFTAAGVECTVAAGPAALSYLAADAADMRISAVSDSLILTNTTVALTSETSGDYEANGTYPTFGAMAGFAPADGKVFHVRNADATNPAGYYRHDVGPGTWATWLSNRRSRDMWSKPDYWTAAARNPGGITLGFVRSACEEENCDWDEGDQTITKAEAFADYTWQAGDHIYIASGTSVDTGWYEVQSKTDDDTIVLVDDAGGGAGDQNDWDIDGIGPANEVTWDFQRESFTDLYDVTQALQEAFRAAGFAEALVSWVPSTSSPATGHILITSPYRGEGTAVHDPLAPTSDVLDYTATEPAWAFATWASDPTDGTGNPDSATLALDERWTRIAAPNQPHAVLDDDALPLALTLEVTSGYYGDSYSEVVLADKPWGYWRLGEAAGATAADETGRNDGTYGHSPTLGEDSLVERDSDTAVTFNGTSEYVYCGTLDDFADSAWGTGVTLEAWIKTETEDILNAVCGWSEGGEQTFAMSVFTGGNLAITMRTAGAGAGESRDVTTNLTSPGVADNQAHHIVATWDGADTFAIYIDGEPVDVDVSGSDPLSPWTDFVQPFCIAARETSAGTVSAYLPGTLDEVAVYDYPLSATQAHLHYRAGVESSIPAFSLEPVETEDRLAGDTISNPLPLLWDEGQTLADVAYLRGRVVLAGGPRLLMGRSGDEWAFWLDDPENLGDADPIDLQVAGTSAAEIEYVVPFRKMLVVFTSADEQFEITAEGVMSPGTTVNSTSTAYPADPDVSPVVMGNRLYFACPTGTEGHIRQYEYDDLQAASEARSITSHVGGYLPADLKSLAAASNDAMLFVLPTAGDELYVYRYHTSNEELVQSAWCRWTVDATERISDIAVLSSNLYALVEGGSVWQLVKIPLVDEGAASNMPSTVYLDNRRTLTGTNDGTYTSWDFTDACSAPPDTVVLGGTFGGETEALEPGRIVSGTELDGTHTLRVADADGDYAGEPCYVGREFTSNVTLSRPYRRDRNGTAILDHDVRIMALRINHVSTGTYSVTISQTDRVDRTTSYTAASADGIDGEGVFRVSVGAAAADTTITLSTSSPYPWRLAGLEYDVDITRSS